MILLLMLATITFRYEIKYKNIIVVIGIYFIVTKDNLIMILFDRELQVLIPVVASFHFFF
jgi:hypothetical protein